MNCDHASKVNKWGYNLIDGDMVSYVAEYGCSHCDATSDKPLPSKDDISVDHGNCKYDPCFGCKAKTLQLNSGDASRDVPDKKWNSELQAYRDARAEGIQPAGTTMQHIEEAHKASEHLGRAYDADSMPKAKDINHKSAEVMKELGV
jgi:hypothetical protein